jgi:hypothetical protein
VADANILGITSHNVINTLTLDVRAFAPSPIIFKSAARFTRDGSDELERHVERTCQKVLATIRRIIPPHRLQGITLGGGYGRGEGGVLKTPLGDQPYNDLEFYIFARGPAWFNERCYAVALHHAGEELSKSAGVEVEFKITSLSKLRRSPPSMFYYDLLLGHCWLHGDDGLFDGCDHHRHARLIPISEATRLMMNRCSGLLFAREKLRRENFTGDDADFVCRNIAKARLALGDAVLTAFGQYHWSCVERNRRLNEISVETNLPCLDSVRRQHARGVEFKLHPHRSPASREDLEIEHREISALAAEVWLWLESRRLHRAFNSMFEYALCREDKFPETNSARNWLTNLKIFGPAIVTDERCRRHPRERILNALALLLWTDCHLESELRRTVLSELRAPDVSQDLISVYTMLWSRVR